MTGTVRGAGSLNICQNNFSQIRWLYCGNPSLIAAILRRGRSSTVTPRAFANVATQLQVFRLVHHAHSADNLAEYSVMGDRLAPRVGRAWPLAGMLGRSGRRVNFFGRGQKSRKKYAVDCWELTNGYVLQIPPYQREARPKASRSSGLPGSIRYQCSGVKLPVSEIGVQSLPFLKSKGDSGLSPEGVGDEK